MLTEVNTRLQPQFTASRITLVCMSALTKRLLEACGSTVTQADLHRACKVSRVAVSKWFAGGDIKAVHLFRIADATGVSPRWLVTGEGPKKPLPARLGLSDDALELATLYDRLPPQVQQNINDLLHTLTLPAAGSNAA
jgi:transcriptional regulator with XRE-family HTH domain